MKLRELMTLAQSLGVEIQFIDSKKEEVDFLEKIKKDFKLINEESEKDFFMPKLTAHERAYPNQPFYAKFYSKK